MTIFEFLELNAGQWFSHRTSHHVSSTEQSGLKANIAIELIDHTTADVVQLCQNNGVDSSQIIAAQINWESIPELGRTKTQSGADLIIFVPERDDSESGRFYRKGNLTQTTSRYRLNPEDRLMLITEGEDLQVEEAIWFESPNVRLRHSVIVDHGATHLISFASEIRRMTAPAQGT